MFDVISSDFNKILVVNVKMNSKRLIVDLEIEIEYFLMKKNFENEKLAKFLHFYP